MSSSQSVGNNAENKASAFLKSHGLVYIARNYQCRLGEIDLIFQDGEEVVFVEVKYRKNTVFGTGLESITTSKQQKIIKTAMLFLKQHPRYQNFSCRFDAICLDNTGVTDWVKAAFMLNS